MDNTIRTYLIMSDVSNYMNEIGTQSSIYEISDFTPPKLNLYNSHTMGLQRNSTSFTIKNPFYVNKIVDTLLDKNYDKSRYYLTVVKFWGNVSQTFTFIGCYPSSLGGSTLEIGFDQGSFSEKNSDNSKYWVNHIIPTLRDKKLDQLFNIKMVNIW